MPAARQVRTTWWASCAEVSTPIRLPAVAGADATVVPASSSSTGTCGQPSRSSGAGGSTRARGAPRPGIGRIARLVMMKASPPATQTMPAPMAGTIWAAIHRAPAGSRRQSGGGSPGRCAARRSVQQRSARFAVVSRPSSIADAGAWPGSTAWSAVGGAVVNRGSASRAGRSLIGVRG